MSVLPGVRSRMNGTLISHPPGGGGSGSSVTNGGPARVEPVATKQPIPIRAGQIFIGRSFPLDDVNCATMECEAKLFMSHLQDAAFSGVDQVCRFAFSSDNTARSLNCRNQRLQM